MRKVKNVLLIAQLEEEKSTSLSRAAQRVMDKYVIPFVSSIKDGINELKKCGGEYNAILIDVTFVSEENLSSLKAEAKEIKIPLFFCSVGNDSLYDFSRVR